MLINKKRIAFLGCGNMVQALFPNWHKLDPTAQFFTYTPSETKALEFAHIIGGKAVKSLFDLPPCDIYVFGFKPQTLHKVFADFKPTNKEAIGVSLLAAVTFSELEEASGLKSLYRLMPNTPSLVGEGMMGVCSKNIPDHANAYFEHIFNGLSKTIELETEEELDTITPYSGSGPAYFFEIARIMAHDCIERGIEPQIARKLVAQTLLGAGKMLVEASEPPAKLRDNVTSKGGVTAAVLNSLKDQGLEKIFVEAISAGHNRLSELKKNSKV
ncbi:MAG: hypothetical protein COW01_08650 [Bdellovibrionales bacterium CG12_big_fil_rev_8_21_14_0_65_38_15]|nr:MAG: hypothetical protein COW79_01635 [Bdellovibrionales bacterium CG22_combo_CG10-13_8_21_14_all_38_13]PIQ55071.1 MAG: hypothetical protein COW01_08650 [Bdellovibrionales bacterium CG12_big_fil_rev_8_21_14_0_65_38_15]PIR30552.1 MAG: hypothetical protein COV38_05225 [Bdellovibrionales bacterium CG11_big_fil_rev_8_21_14_0_20_38_13]